MFTHLHRLLTLPTAAILFFGCSEEAVQTDVSSAETGMENIPVAVKISADTPLSFNQHVQPILSEYCYHCHGPDSGSRKPDLHPLRLDREEYAFEKRPDGSAQPIVKGDPGASEIIARLHTTDKNLVMPPPQMHKTMKPHEIEILERWVEEGANYEEHWSFLPPVKVDPPENADVPEGWNSNPIDAYTLRKMRENGLEPNPREEPSRLLRRVSFDLTGLPPKADAAEAFAALSDAEIPAAYDAAVDKMLTTDEHAEQLTRQWLDAVRYADTHGIHIDNYRAIWPYRDWVLKAYKDNMPFDQFTIEQIGGDLLPDPTPSQIVATGYNRCLPTTGEGGAIREEYEAIYAQDRTDTTSAVWLGMTMGCAACHDHKFDPITQVDNFTFNAFFRNTTMDAMDANDAEHAPAMFAPRYQDIGEWEKLSQAQKSARASLENHAESAARSFDAWAKDQPSVADPDFLSDGLRLHLPFSTEGDNQPAIIAGRSETLAFADYKTGRGLGSPGLALDGKQYDVGDFANFDSDETFTISLWVYVDSKGNGTLFSRWDSKQNKGFVVRLNGRNITYTFRSGKDVAGINGRTSSGLRNKEWNYLTVTYDGGRNPYGALSFELNGQPVSARNSRAELGPGMNADSAPFRIGSDRVEGPFKGNVFLQDFRVYDRRLTEVERAAIRDSGYARAALAKPADKRNDKDNESLKRYYSRYVETGAKELVGQLVSLERSANPILSRGSRTLIMEERDDQPAFAHVLDRGVYSEKKEKVFAAVPSVLPQLPEGETADRLALGRWLVDKDNPLTARVTMNRLWYYIFGEALVTSVADFGIMGARPSHPQLLDWLAMEFMESGWDYRHMVRLMVTSATYQQSARVREDHQRLDLANTWLARGPRRRLDAEQIRDMALHAAELLRPSLGGPSVQPYQPEGIWESVAMDQSNTRFYKQSAKQDELYRRSVYTFWKRTAPHPAMEILNAPTREVFCVKRDLTNTPLQAFVTLNDPQFIESARALAEVAIREADTFDDRLDLITMRLLARTFDGESREIVREVLDGTLESYKSSPDNASALITVGSTTPDKSLDSAEVAAWTMVTSKIFNLDETLNK